LSRILTLIAAPHANIATEQMDAAKAFYGEALGMTMAMDHGWIVTFAGSGQVSPQISIAIESGSGTPVALLHGSAGFSHGLVRFRTLRIRDADTTAYDTDIARRRP
jgi:catechol 2,3-dioxygenase-like lactoylglutathione lyase family enzyme